MTPDRPPPTQPPRQPKLVFFRSTTEGLPDFIRLHLQQQQFCLSQFFDVVVIEGDCDYRQVCDEHHPDMTLFESGVYARPRRIVNTDCNPGVLKAGLCNADAYCLTRSTFMSDMAHWDVGTYFGIAVALGEYFPAIADNLFTWPNFVDDQLYHDYGESKVIPVCATGSQARHYPWRNRINRILSQCYPALSMPHFGWFLANQTTRVIYGERYARMLNASMFATACGTIAKEVVRKHFEIPACRTCLLTEQTASIKAAGFRDMVNCVFVDDESVVEKVDYLMSHPEELQRITDAGYELVHARHTARQRTQIFDWYRLQRARNSGQRIVQPGPFEPLQLVNADAGPAHTHVISGGTDRGLLHEGYRSLHRRRFLDSQRSFVSCLNYHLIPEPLLGLALCSLWMGRPEQALSELSKLITIELEEHHAADPDPVEWAWYVLALLCHGEPDAARARIGQFPMLAHVELSRARTVIALLGSMQRGTNIPPPVAKQFERPSVHRLPERSFNAWLEDLRMMLRACGQERLADQLANPPTRAAFDAGPEESIVGSVFDPDAPSVTNARPFSAAQKLVVSKVRTRLTAMGEHVTNRLRRARGVPGYRPGDNIFLNELRAIGSEEALESAIIVAPLGRSRLVAALDASLRLNTSRPTILQIDVESLPQTGGGTFGIDSNSLYRLMSDHRVKVPSLMCLDGSETEILIDYQAMQVAHTVIVIGINHYRNHALYIRLLADRNFVFGAADPDHWNGCAVFRRVPAIRRMLSPVAGSATVSHQSAER